MQIQNSQSMFQHIESGGSLALNKQGQLETQGAAGRFFQKIGDAFRSLTSSGRAAIETRNAHLETAMANMLRRDTLVNPAQSDISSPLTPAEHNALAMRLGVEQVLTRFPEESRGAARNLGLDLLRLPGVLGPNDSPAQIRGKALEVMDKIHKDPVVSNALRCNYARTHEQLGIQLREIGAEMCETFTTEKNAGRVNENGIHTGCFIDAPRSASIDGVPVPKGPGNGDADEASLTAKLTEMVPNEKIRAFVTTALMQAGLVGAVTFQVFVPGKTRDNPDMPESTDLLTKGLSMECPHHHEDISVVDGKVRIKQEVDIVVKAMHGLHGVANELGIACDRTPASTAAQIIGGGHYSFEMVVDLGQDMTDKDIPEFTLVNASRTPFPAQPPAGQAASAA